MTDTINAGRIAEDLINLGVQPGDHLLVTCSLTSFGHLHDGTSTILKALQSVLGSKGTVFGLSFTHLYKLPLSAKNRANIFTPNSPAYSGAFNNFLIDYPKSIRSHHPATSIVGIGKLAAELLKNHGPDSPAYEPVHRLSKLDNGKMLLLGTRYKNPGVTTVHVAQNLLQLKNRTTGEYGVHYRLPNGECPLYRKNYVGGCSRGFGKFFEYYKEAEAFREGNVANAPSALALLKKTLQIDLEILRKAPSFFLCDDPYCFSCRVTWDFSDTSYLRFKFRTLLKKALRK